MQRFNSIIKIKTGCADCPQGNTKPIYALGKCMFHYKIHSNKARQDRARERNPQLSLEHKLLWEWYEERIREQKGRCEECGDRIVHRDKKYEHWSCCHILPKEFFKSIKTNDKNIIELCHTCHTLYDNYLQNHDERLMQMRIFPIVVEKIKILKPFITEHRRLNGLPDFILNNLK